MTNDLEYAVVFFIIVCVLVFCVVALMLPQDKFTKEIKCGPAMGLWKIKFSNSIGVGNTDYVRMTSEEEQQYCDYALEKE